MTVAARRSLIDPQDAVLPVSRQCALLALSRSTWYYRSCADDTEDMALMRALDEQYTATPFYGVRRMTHALRQQGYEINPKRVRRLMHLLGLEALYPKPRTSVPAPGHTIYPYLLRGTKIVRVNQVWSTDITYIRLQQGFVYLAAVLDWHSRFVLSWELSNTLESGFCVSALERALSVGTPEIFNTDQGSQFTSEAFTKPLLDRGISISMDGRGRALDNVFVERLWRSVKYEEVYLKDYRSLSEARQGLSAYFAFYNTKRLHQSLDYRTPAEVYRARVA